MKKIAFVAGLAAVAMSASAVTTNTFYVAEGQTLTVAQVVAASNFTFYAGDWLRKTGKGQLTAVTTYTNIQVNLLIEEGVYYANVRAHAKGGTMIIKNGATFNHTGKAVGGGKAVLDGIWNISFEGHGTGEGDCLGAVAVGGNATDCLLDTNAKWTMTGDATIYTYSTMNAIFSGSAANSGPTLNMNGHTLTIRGKTYSSVFRPRWKWTIRTSGPIVVRNGQFARHLTTNDISPNIPLVSFTDGARMAAYTDSASSPWTYVNAFSFEAGTKILKGNGSPDTATMNIKKLTGPVDISAANVTISQEFGVRGTDVANGDKLTSANALTFSDGCKVSVTNWGSLALSPGTTYTVATSSAGITGTPVPTGDAAAIFTAANTGTALTLTVKSGFIDVTSDWGVQQGAENAAANTAAVAAHVGDVADGVTIYFPAGEYWFTDTFDLSSVTATGVTVLNLEKSAILHSGITLGAATDVTVKGLAFKECAGPAVVATGTTGLVIDGCAVDNVDGSYAGGHYPFAAVNVTGFNLKNCTWAADEAIWDGQAYFDGGTQDDFSEAYAGAIVAYVPKGIWLNNDNHDWANWSELTKRMCLAATAFSGKTLRKIGTGTLDTNADLAALGIVAVEVMEGQYVVRHDNHLGVAKGPVHVRNGANLTIAGGNKVINNRTITVSGAGIGSENPAVRFTNNLIWDKTDHATWALEGDTTMYAAATGENGTFLWGTMRANGHNLQLNGVTGGHYRFGRSFDWYGGGTVTVSRATLSASSSDNGYQIKDGRTPKFFFTNGAKFVPDDGTICAIMKDCDFAAGTQIAPKYATTLEFRDLTGAPTGSTNATTITVTGTYTARSAEVSAGTHATLAGALSFGENATVELDDPTIPMGTYTLFTAEEGVANKPKTTGATAEAGWSVFKRGANTLCIGPTPGTMMIIR